MDDVLLWVVIAVVACVAGMVIGQEANKNYVQEHCDSVQVMVIDKQAYSCTKR